MSANERFHAIIVNASNNDVMINIIDRMQSIIYLFRHTVVLQPPILIDEHEDIYNAIKERNAEKLKR